MVVVAIIGVLAAYVGPRYFSQLGHSRQTTARAQMDALAKALDAYRLDMGSYPSSSEGLDALMRAPADAPQWRGPYLAKAIPQDPWGRSYRYGVPGLAGKEFDLETWGKDGQKGGQDEDADLAY